MNYSVIGTCGDCGGPVGVPIAWWGINPPQPQCLHCHAIPEQSWGPVLPMRKQYPAYPMYTTWKLNTNHYGVPSKEFTMTNDTITTNTVC